MEDDWSLRYSDGRYHQLDNIGHQYYKLQGHRTPGQSYQELLIRYSPVAVLVSELEHLADLGLGDMLGQVGHHLSEVGQTEGFLLDLVLLCSELDWMRLRPADGLKCVKIISGFLGKF